MLLICGEFYNEWVGGKVSKLLISMLGVKIELLIGNIRDLLVRGIMWIVGLSGNNKLEEMEIVVGFV